MLLDNGDAMNSGNLTYNLLVMSQYPEMVDEFIQCGDGTRYDVVQLLAALYLDSSHQPLDHGKMTAVIRYRTPYFINNRDSLFICFALGNDISLRCVLGLPNLLVLGGLINLVKGEFIRSDIGPTFPLTLDPPDKGYLRVLCLIIAPLLYHRGCLLMLNLTLLFFTILPPKVVLFTILH